MLLSSFGLIILLYHNRNFVSIIIYMFRPYDYLYFYYLSEIDTPLLPIEKYVIFWYTISLRKMRNSYYLHNNIMLYVYIIVYRDWTYRIVNNNNRDTQSIIIT